jgi:hypothetical protein
MKYLLIFTILVTISCTPQKRLNRIIRHHPELLTKDTVTVKDTVVIESIKADTTFISKNNIDTFYLNKDKLRIQIIKHFDTLKVSGECVGDTIIRIIQVPYEKIVVQETFFSKYGKWVIFLLIAIVLFFCVKKLIL